MTPGVGTQAVLPSIPLLRPIQGAWPAVMKNGIVYVHRMHHEASVAANGGVFGPVDRTGLAILDAAGKVIQAVWDG